MTDRGSDIPPAPAEAVSPSGINHLVLNVRDLDSAPVLDRDRRLKQVAALRSAARPPGRAEDAVLQRGQ